MKLIQLLAVQVPTDENIITAFEKLYDVSICVITQNEEFKVLPISLDQLILYK